MNIDRMGKEDFERYWLDKDGTALTRSGRTGPTFSRCRQIVQAFMDNPANRDLLATLRPGIAMKAVTAVCEGQTLTRDLWNSLSGNGPEIASSARDAA